ncbi:WSSV545 [White spot syndrome virus]|uniref:WSSV545 n=1 Tax=White spot syndrome virus TaxID=342409 RepID=A0A2I6SCH8_9VIRU|nr:WSSV545 [White spot syndrome virus]
MEKVVEEVLGRQDLFDHKSEIAKGLARFDTHVSLFFG